MVLSIAEWCFHLFVVPTPFAKDYTIPVDFNYFLVLAFILNKTNIKQPATHLSTQKKKKSRTLWECTFFNVFKLAKVKIEVMFLF